MIRTPLFLFFCLGEVIRDLRLTAFGTNSATDIPDAAETLKKFIQMPDEDCPLPKSKEAARVLVDVLTQLANQITFGGSINETTVAVSSSELAPVSSAINRFASIFEQETQDAHVYWIQEIGAYSTPSLVEAAEKHLSKQTIILAAAAPTLLTDFRLAGRTLAFDLFTASGFHAMRAVEAQARLYHMVVTHMPEQLEDVPLGPLINGAKGDFDGLRDVWTREGAKNDSPLGLIISLLSSLNKIYRCPIMHPDMMLTGDTAKLVFDLAAIVISSMMQDAVDRVQVQLPSTSAMAQGSIH